MKTLGYPNSTETMAERAWRYGEQGVPHRPDSGYCYFPDGSRLGRWAVDTPHSLRRVYDVMDATAARMGGWAG